MPKLKVLKGQNEQLKPQKEEYLPKLVFVGKNASQIQKAEKFAKNNQFEFLSYSEEEWATLEEIDQYIQEEELSKQVITLPIGQNKDSSLDAIEAETIQKVIKQVNGNMKKAAQVLKIARATLYRKMKRHSLDLKREREKQYKNSDRKIKRVA